MGLDLTELNAKLKAIRDFEVEKAMYKYIKSDLEHLLLKKNWEQIFVDNTDIDEDILGYYKPITEKIAKARGMPSKKANTPFTMINTGEFSGSLRIKTHYRKITIWSTSPTYEKIMLDTNANYQSKEFFGLTEKNLNRIIKTWILPMLREKLLLQ